ncbi:hypothetical protein CR513_40057, partial [Mucuna pruriens]
MFVHQYELFIMGDHKSINQMFGWSQTIINNLRSLVKFIALKAHKAYKQTSSKAFKVEESSDVASEEEDFDEDELSFVFEKIHYKWKKKGRLRWRNYSKKTSKDNKHKTKVVCYECNKPRHFKSKCPTLEKKEKKKKGLSSRKRKEDVDLSSTNEEGKEEKANLCLMANIEYESEEDKVIFKDLNHLQFAYQEILSNFSTLFICFKDLKRRFSKISKDFESL